MRTSSSLLVGGLPRNCVVIMLSLSLSLSLSRSEKNSQEDIRRDPRIDSFQLTLLAVVCPARDLEVSDRLRADNSGRQNRRRSDRFRIRRKSTTGCCDSACRFSTDFLRDIRL